MSSQDASVVIVSFAQPSLLAACLASVSGSVDIVVVDNAGDPESQAVGAADPRVRWITSPNNRGFAAACNLGWRAARTATVVFLNSDAELTPGALEVLVHTLDARPGAGLVAPQLRFPDGRLQPSTGSFPRPLGYVWSRLRPASERGYHRRGYEHAHEVDWATGACLAARRSALEAAGGFSEDYFLNLEDVDLCLRLARAGWHTWYTPAALVVHKVGGSSGEGARAIVAREKRRSQLIYFAKHHGLAAFETVRGLNAVHSLWQSIRNRAPGRVWWRQLFGELTSGSKAAWATPPPPACERPPAPTPRAAIHP
jgi:GT2 family glycosyltransferase